MTLADKSGPSSSTFWCCTFPVSVSSMNSLTPKGIGRQCSPFSLFFFLYGSSSSSLANEFTSACAHLQLILAPFFHFLNLMNTHTAFDDVYRSCRLRIEYIQFFLSHYFSFIPFPSIAIVNLHLPIYQTGRLASLHIDTGSTAPAASVALAALTALNRKRKLKQTNAYNFSA